MSRILSYFQLPTQDPNAFFRLTGVFNRRALLDRLRAELSRAKRGDGRLSVGMCDLDHFKKVNDTYGHQAGDEMLVAFTQRVQANLRNYDCVGRYGGEEFIVIAADSSGQSDGDLYERLRGQIAAAAIMTKAGIISMTVSIGVAQGTGQSTVDELLAAADAALYQAKAGGRNRVAYSGGDGGHATHRAAPHELP